MLALATSETMFIDMPCSGTSDFDAAEITPVQEALRALTGRARSKFKEREMFPLLQDMWFYAENHSTGVVKLQFRGKGMLSRRHWPAEMSTVSMQTFNLLRKQLGRGINEVISMLMCAYVKQSFLILTDHSHTHTDN